MNYLVTGATGELGRYALNKLKALMPEATIYALARNEEKAASLKEAGFAVRLGDYLNPESLVAAFNGIDRLLFVSSSELENRQTQHQNVVTAAKEAGVKFIAYTSFAQAEKGAAQNNGLALDHFFTEKAIIDSGIAHTFLRNNWYLENDMLTAQSALASGKVVSAAGTGRVGWALKREYGEAAGIVLAGQKDFGEIVELSGQPVSYAEFTAALAEASGQELTLVAGDPAEFVASLEAIQLPTAVAQIFAGFQADIKAGVLEMTSIDFETVLGKPLTPLVAAFKELLAK